MCRYTLEQYNEAIRRLQEGKQQLHAEARPCAICGDDGHLAYECGFNPLVAMDMCVQIAHQSEALHETLHQLAGFNTHMGVQLGPARVVPPEASEPTACCPECGSHMLEALPQGVLGVRCSRCGYASHGGQG